MTKHITLPLKPLASIITVTFNLIAAKREDHIRQCIKSVHNQKNAYYEHIIIDGGSNDGTLEILEEYAQKGWIKYYSEPDNGIFDAMNKGIQKASGKYVAFLNSDDFYHDDCAIAVSIAALEKLKADFSYAPCMLLDEERGFCEYSGCGLGQVFNSAPFYHLTMFTKRDVLLKENMFDTSYEVAADTDLIIRLCLKGYKPCEVKHNFATFRCGGASADRGKCIRELQQVYYKNYNQLTRISICKCHMMLWSHYLPFRLFKKILWRCHWRIVLAVIRYHYFTKEGRAAILCKRKKQTVYHILAGFKNTYIDDTAIILEGATFQNPYDNKVTIGKGSIFQGNIIFESNKGEIDIGANTFIGGGTKLISRSKITIEDWVQIAWGCTIYDHNSHSLSWQQRRLDMMQQVKDYCETGDFIRNKNWDVVKTRPITIKHDSWIGAESVILNGVTIGEKAVIGMRSCIREDVEPLAIMEGNPSVITGYADDK